MCEEGLGLKGKKKLEGKGLSLSAGAPLGTEGECGATTQDASRTLWQCWGAPWPWAPAFGERGRWGCWGLWVLGGRSAGWLVLLGVMFSGLRGLAFRVSEGQLTPKLLSVAPLPGKHIPAGSCIGILVAYTIRWWKRTAGSSFLPLSGWEEVCRRVLWLQGFCTLAFLGALDLHFTRASHTKASWEKAVAQRLRRPGRQRWGTLFGKMAWYCELRDCNSSRYLVYEVGLKWRMTDNG